MRLTDHGHVPGQAHRHPAPTAHHEDGVALATVIWVVVIAGIIAATLAVMTVFATGYTSSQRASLQATAAAEGGIDFARTTLLDPAVCRSGGPGAPGIVTHPTPDPGFSVQVWHQLPTATTTQLVPGCPVPGASEVRLQATGIATDRGLAGQAAGNTETVDSVYTGTKPEFAYAEMTTQAPKAGGHLLELSAGPDGTGLSTHSGDSQFPRITRDDYRWHRFAAISVEELAREMTVAFSSTCTLTATASATPLQVKVPLRVDARSNSCSALRMTSGPGESFTVDLWADLVLFADQFELSGTLTVRSADARPHTLYIVRPSTSPCSTASSDGVKVGLGTSGSGIQTANGARVMLYSGADMAFGVTGSPRTHAFDGQIYACALAYHDKVRLTYAPATARVLGNAAPWPATRLVSKLDVPNPTS